MEMRSACRGIATRSTGVHSLGEEKTARSWSGYEIGGRAADILDSDDKMLVCRSGRSIVAVNMDSKPREVRTGTNCAAVQVNAYDCFIFPEEN